jgi:hypothetical protein
MEKNAIFLFLEISPVFEVFYLKVEKITTNGQHVGNMLKIVDESNL